MNKEDKIKEGHSQLDNTDHYQPLDHPMVVETAGKVTSLIEDLYDGQFIDETTMEWLLQKPKLPQVPEFYMLTKIKKPKLVGHPIISGCDGPTERISAFVDEVIHPIAKIQKSYIEDTTDFINFIERKKLPQNPLLGTMDVTSLYTNHSTNIPQEQGMQIVRVAYNKFYKTYKSNLPIPTRLILEDNSFQFTNKLHLQRHGTAMGTKEARVAFANIFMTEIETQILRQSKHKPLEWIRYVDDIASLWVTTKDEVLQFIQKANPFHPTIKFTAEISEGEATFSDTTIYKGERFTEIGILDVHTHFKPTEKFQYTHFK